MRAFLFPLTVVAVIAFVSSSPREAQAQIVYPTNFPALHSSDTTEDQGNVYPTYSSWYYFNYPSFYEPYWATPDSYWWVGGMPWYYPYPYRAGFFAGPRYRGFNGYRGWHRR